MVMMVFSKIHRKGHKENLLSTWCDCSNNITNTRIGGNRTSILRFLDRSKNNKDQGTRDVTRHKVAILYMMTNRKNMVIAAHFPSYCSNALTGDQ